MLNFILLNEVEENTQGAAFRGDKLHWRFDLRATGVAVGGTISLQYRDPKDDWIEFHSQAFAAAAAHRATLDFPISIVRAVLSSYSAGVFTVTAEAC